MVLMEAAKGYGVYQLGEAAKRSGYPSSLVISTEIGIILLSNFSDELDERK